MQHMFYSEAICCQLGPWIKKLNKLPKALLNFKAIKSIMNYVDSEKANSLEFESTIVDVPQTDIILKVEGNHGRGYLCHCAIKVTFVQMLSLIKVIQFSITF